MNLFYGLFSTMCWWFTCKSHICMFKKFLAFSWELIQPSWIYILNKSIIAVFNCIQNYNKIKFFCSRGSGNTRPDSPHVSIGTFPCQFSTRWEPDRSIRKWSHVKFSTQTDEMTWLIWQHYCSLVSYAPLIFWKPFVVLLKSTKSIQWTLIPKWNN